MEADPARTCEILVGLPNVDEPGVTDAGDGMSPGVVEVASRAGQGRCRECDVKAWS